MIPQAPSTSSGPKQAMVLVIDPDPSVQREMRERLTGLGYTARAVDDFGAAMPVVASTPPDVVLVSGNSSKGEGWNDLQSELNHWGIPLLDFTDLTDPMSTSPLPEAPPRMQMDELKLRVDAALQSRTLQDALMTENARLAAERLHDPMTGLYNRRYMLIRIEEEVLRSSRRGHPISCMLLDIDDFDEINEKWSHQAGDNVLRDMAHLITRTMRGSDIICRYRDDEFLILLTDTDASGAQVASNRLRDAVAAYTFYNSISEEPIKLTISIGVAYWQPVTKPGQPGTWEPQLLGLAERALKAAKQSGANRLVILQAS